MKIINFFDIYKNWNNVFVFNENIQQYLVSKNITTCKDLSTLNLDTSDERLNKNDINTLNEAIFKIHKFFMINEDISNISFFNLPEIQDSFYSYSYEYFNIQKPKHQKKLTDENINNLYDLIQLIYNNLDEKNRIKNFIDVFESQIFFAKKEIEKINKLLNFYENLFYENNPNKKITYNLDIINFLLSKIKYYNINVTIKCNNFNIKCFVIDDFDFEEIINDEDLSYIKKLISANNNKLNSELNTEINSNNLIVEHNDSPIEFENKHNNIKSLFQPISNFIELTINQTTILNSNGFLNLYDLLTKENIYDVIKPSRLLPKIILNKLQNLKKIWKSNLMFPLNEFSYFYTEKNHKILDYSSEYFLLNDKQSIIDLEILKVKKLSELKQMIDSGNSTPKKYQRALDLWNSQILYEYNEIETVNKKIKFYVECWEYLFEDLISYNKCLDKFISNFNSILDLDEYNINQCYLEFLVAKLQKTKVPIETSKLLSNLKIKGHEDELIQTIKNDNNVVQERNYWYYKHPSIETLKNTDLNSMNNENDEIIEKIINKKIIVSEYIYSYLYKNYDINTSLLEKYFNLTKLQTTFIKKTAKAGTKRLIVALNDSILFSDIKKTIHTILLIENKIFIFNNEIIKLNTMGLCEYILKLFDNKLISNELIIEKIINFIDDNNLINIVNYNLFNDRLYECALVESANILTSLGKQSRYYNINKYLEEEWLEFIEQLNLNKYQNMIISTKMLFENNKELMQKFDLNNEYVLHSLLRKLQQIFNCLEQVTFSRMPYIIIGKADREKQMFNFLATNYPIKINTFFENYSNQYGFNLNTIIGNSANFIKKYRYKNDYLSIENDFNPPKESLNILLNKLHKNIYNSDEFIRIINNTLNTNIQIITIDTAQKLGYSYIKNYVYKNEYKSFTDALYETYFSNKSLIKVEDIELYDEKISNIFNINTCLYNSIFKLLSEYKILFINKNRRIFTTTEHLNKVSNITIDNIYDFVNKALLFANEEYFTYKSLIQRKFKHKIIDLGFDDFFYESILKYSLDISFITTSQPIFIKKDNIQPNINDFLDYVITKNFWEQNINSFYLDDLWEILKTEYALELKIDKLKTKIMSIDKYYFNEITEIIYKNKTIFLEKFKEN